MTAAAAEPGFVALLDLVQRERGLRCDSYKHSCLRRRIMTRMRARGADTYESYLAIVTGEARELDRLTDALTINVTRFFRNLPTWELLAAQVVPELWSRQLEQVRVWSAGCASGEEALSMAMLFHRHASRLGMLPQIGRLLVTGTDVDAAALRDARNGAYSEADLAEVPEGFRSRYFSDTPPFRISPGVRRLVEFTRHDLLAAEGPSRLQHMISCRNVLIYFERPFQEQILSRFYEWLAPGGYLVLGKVESIVGPARTGFEPIAHRERIFRRIS